MSCGTSANAMSLVTQTSRPIRGKGADVMFGLSALSAGSRLQDLTTTTSIKRCLPNLTMLPILPWQIQMLLQLCVFVIQQGGRWWIRKHCWIPHSFSFLPSCLKKAWIHKYPNNIISIQMLCLPRKDSSSVSLYTRSPPQARAIKLRIALVLVEWSHAGGGETNIDLGQYWSLAAWPACIPLQRTHQELYSVPKVADKQPLTTVVNQLCKLNIMNCKISKKVYK